LSQLRQRESIFDELDVLVKIISFDARFLAIAYVKETNLSWPLLQDPNQELYAAYGMLHAGWREIYGVSSILGYMRSMLRGNLPGKPGKDWHQLGGDVLIDPQGVVRLLHISTNPHDRPAVDSLIAAIER
jgi:alkyl hydroperoxide reductase subunit AhpC